MSIAQYRLIALVALAIFGAAIFGVSRAAADPILIPGYVPASPAADAAALADLAPPSNRATARRTYGDAPIAKRYVRSGSRRVRGYACIDLGASVDRCPVGTVPRPGTFHVITPAYVSAPEVVGAPPGRPSPLRSPFVGFVFDVYDTANAALPARR